MADKKGSAMGGECHPLNLPFFDYFSSKRTEAMKNGQKRAACTSKRVCMSLKKYPLPIRSSQQAVRLEGVGKCLGAVFERILRNDSHIFQEIEEQQTQQIENFRQKCLARANSFVKANHILQRYKRPPDSAGDHLQHPRNSKKRKVAASPEDMPSIGVGSGANTVGSCGGSTASGNAPLKKKAADAAYQPKPSSQAWLALVCLYMFGHRAENNALNSVDLIAASEEICKFVTAAPIKTMRTLKLLDEKYSLVERLSTTSSAPTASRKLIGSSGKSQELYRLTEQGIATAEKLIATADFPVTLFAGGGDCTPSSQSQAAAAGLILATSHHAQCAGGLPIALPSHETCHRSPHSNEGECFDVADDTRATPVSVKGNCVPLENASSYADTPTGTTRHNTAEPNTQTGLTKQQPAGKASGSQYSLASLKTRLNAARNITPTPAISSTLPFTSGLADPTGFTAGSADEFEDPAPQHDHFVDLIVGDVPDDIGNCSLYGSSDDQPEVPAEQGGAVDEQLFLHAPYSPNNKLPSSPPSTFSSQHSTPIILSSDNDNFPDPPVDQHLLSPTSHPTDHFPSTPRCSTPHHLPHSPLSASCDLILPDVHFPRSAAHPHEAASGSHTPTSPSSTALPTLEAITNIADVKHRPVTSENYQRRVVPFISALSPKRPVMFHRVSTFAARPPESPGDLQSISSDPSSGRPSPHAGSRVSRDPAPPPPSSRQEGRHPLSSTKCPSHTAACSTGLPTTTAQQYDATIVKPPNKKTSPDVDSYIPRKYKAWSLVMLLDNREVGGSRTKLRDYFYKGLLKEGVAVEICRLPVGDVLWVIRRKGHLLRPTDAGGGGGGKTGEEGEEVVDQFVLPWVLERKAMEDLSASIMDGRYEEQKYRMLRSPGMVQVFYLLEGLTPAFAADALSSSAASAAQRTAQPAAVGGRLRSSALFSAQIHTQLISGFTLLASASVKTSVALCAALHRQIATSLQQLSKDTPLTTAADVGDITQLNPFSQRADVLSQICLRPKWRDWELTCQKTTQPTVREVFGKQLRTINGCGCECVEAILGIWPTPRAISQGLREELSNQRLLAQIKCHLAEVKLGAANQQASTASRGRSTATRNPVTAKLLEVLRALYAPETSANSSAA